MHSNSQNNHWDEVDHHLYRLGTLDVETAFHRYGSQVVELLPELLEKLQSNEWGIRVGVCKLTGEYASEIRELADVALIHQLEEKLVYQLQHPKGVLVYHAAWALGKLGPSLSLYPTKKLLNQLFHPHLSVRDCVGRVMNLVAPKTVAGVRQRTLKRMIAEKPTADWIHLAIGGLIRIGLQNEALAAEAMQLYCQSKDSENKKVAKESYHAWCSVWAHPTIIFPSDNCQKIMAQQLVNQWPESGDSLKYSMKHFLARESRDIPVLLAELYDIQRRSDESSSIVNDLLDLTK